MYKLHGKRYAYRFNIEEIKGTNLNQSDLLPETNQSEFSIITEPIHCNLFEIEN